MDNNKSTLDAKMKRLKVNNPVSHVFDVRVEIDENKKEHLYAIECCDYYYKSELTKEDCEKLAKYFKALSRMLDWLELLINKRKREIDIQLSMAATKDVYFLYLNNLSTKEQRWVRNQLKFQNQLFGYFGIK